MASNLEQYVRQANNGNRQALETVVSKISDKIYGLALRMLNDLQDAEDETQEILIKVITHLSDYREESAFSSWVYRVACNHLLTKRKQKNERMKMTFDLLEKMNFDKAEDDHAMTVSGPELGVLLEEVRFTCMQSVLSCLEKETRLVLILGEQYGVTSNEGAYILGISPEAFRKRLSRSRELLENYMRKHCGMVNKNNACRCRKKVTGYIDYQGTAPGKKLVLKKEIVKKNREEVVAGLKELSEIDRTVAMYRHYPEYQSPDAFKNIVKELIDTRQFNFL